MFSNLCMGMIVCEVNSDYSLDWQNPHRQARLRCVPVGKDNSHAPRLLVCLKLDMTSSKPETDEAVAPDGPAAVAESTARENRVVEPGPAA